MFTGPGKRKEHVACVPDSTRLLNERDSAFCPVSLGWNEKKSIWSSPLRRLGEGHTTTGEGSAPKGKSIEPAASGGLPEKIYNDLFQLSSERRADKTVGVNTTYADGRASSKKMVIISSSQRRCMAQQLRADESDIFGRDTAAVKLTTGTVGSFLLRKKGIFPNSSSTKLEKMILNDDSNLSKSNNELKNQREKLNTKRRSKITTERSSTGRGRSRRVRGGAQRRQRGRYYLAQQSSRKLRSSERNNNNKKKKRYKKNKKKEKILKLISFHHYKMKQEMFDLINGSFSSRLCLLIMIFLVRTFFVFMFKMIFERLFFGLFR